MQPTAVPMCVCNRISSTSFSLHLSTQNRCHTATIAAPSTSCKRPVHCPHSNSLETTTITFQEEESTTLRLRGSKGSKKHTCNSPPEVRASSVAPEQKIAFEPKWLQSPHRPPGSQAPCHRKQRHSTQSQFCSSRDDFESFTESTISTSLIHHMASEGEPEQTLTWVMNLIFQHEKRWRCGGICQIEAPRSVVFVDQPRNSVRVTLLLERKNSLVDGFLANLGVGIVSRFRSSLLATSFPVLSRTVFPPVTL